MVEVRTRCFHRTISQKIGGTGFPDISLENTSTTRCAHNGELKILSVAVVWIRRTRVEHDKLISRGQNITCIREVGIGPKGVFIATLEPHADRQDYRPGMAMGVFSKVRE